MPSRRTIIALSLLIPAIIVSGYLIHALISQNVDKQKALQISNGCFGEDRLECLSVDIVSYVSQYPKDTGSLFEEFWRLEKDQILSDDPRIFSDIAHEAGMALIRNTVAPQDALTYCGTAFKYGCVHGAVMEYIDTRYPSEVEASQLFDWCGTVSKNETVRLNCIHGVGHALAAKVHSSLQGILNRCDTLSFKEFSACTSGVLMEYSTGVTGSGTHSHSPIGTKELPCSDVADRYKAVCYASAGSYRQYYPNQEEFSASYDFCFAAPSEYVNHCVNGVSERALLATAEDQKKLNILCKEANTPAIKKACLRSVGELMK